MYMYIEAKTTLPLRNIKTLGKINYKSYYIFVGQKAL